MLNLFLRSFIVLALLFGLLFAIGMGVIVWMDLPSFVAVIFALAILLLQYLLGPTIIQLIYKIKWQDMSDVDPQMARFVEQVISKRNIPRPRFGVIQDGNPNAFTFGHYPGNARLVVTSGLLDLLDPDERNAVVAHELGHIAHWDFVVMTMAAAVPLVLYVLYVTTRGASRSRDRGSIAALIGLVSFVAYIVSQYIVLMLSRVREYYADQFAGETTGKPDALSSALVKIAYGLARAPKTEDKKDDTRMVAARALGIFDPKVAQSLALASAGTGAVSASSMESAMKWDLWNPWAGLYELASSHPLPAKRIKALEKQTEAMGGIPRYSFRAKRPESYWDEFLVDLIVNYVPWIGLFLGIGGYFLLNVALGIEVGFFGTTLFALCAGWWLKRRFSYRHNFEEKQTVQGLIDTIKVSRIRSVPCTIKGKIIGRGVPGLFYSDDLVLQDETGFIILDYRQPIRIFEFLFGWIKAEKLIGKRGEAVGWYRRAPRPYFEMRELRLDNHETVVSYLYPFSQFFLYAGLVLGLVLAIFFI
ncbi:MAG TPA: M48 family metalloprotease [Anaerolineae bacterium]|nr:M48 family metalloprotease [Anaerolineae bacterium]